MDSWIATGADGMPAHGEKLMQGGNRNYAQESYPRMYSAVGGAKPYYKGWLKVEAVNTRSLGDSGEWSVGRQ